MASVWKHPKSPYWTACYTLPNGRRVKKSTKLREKKKALQAANILESEAVPRLTQTKARALAFHLYEKLSGQNIVTTSVAAFVEQWIARKKAEVSKGSARKYGEVAKHFLTFLGAAAQRSLDSITGREIAAFRDDMAARLSIGSTNVALKIVRIIFGDALKAKLIASNEAATVPVLKASTERAARRPFTEAELRRLIAVAPPEWRAMILTGFYTGGQRIGDVARLTWQNVDLDNGELRFVTRKTHRSQVVPIAPPLLAALATLASSDDPKAPLFPHAAEVLRASNDEYVGGLSNEFHEILVEAGLAVPHVHHKTGKGRSARRTMGALGFHSLRHTFTSWAKSVGIGSAIVQDMVGHDSAAISAHYTTIDDATKRTALGALPDLTAPAKPSRDGEKPVRD